ncbi:hypothetical protein [Aquaspirillum soli]
MPYNYGAKNGPSIGKAAPGLPVPAKYDGSLSISTSQLVAGARKFINPNFNDRSDWTKVTNGVGVGTATVSAVQNVPSSTNILVQPTGGGYFAGGLKISDTAFVALTSEVSGTAKTNLTLFDVSNGGCAVKSQVPISTDPQNNCGSARVIPSSRPDLILVAHRLYTESAQRIQVFRVDANSGAISNANTGTSAGSPLSISSNEWWLPWVITPLGYFGGREVWVAIRSDQSNSTCYFITLDDAGNLSFVSTAFTYGTGFLQRIGEDNTLIYAAGMAHPSLGGGYNASASPNVFQHSPFRLYSINKSSLAVTLITSAGSSNGGGVTSFGAAGLYFAGFESYGFNGEGFFIGYNANHGNSPMAGFSVGDPYGSPFVCRTDLSNPSKPSASIIGNNGNSSAASAASYVAVSPNVIAARSHSGGVFGGVLHENYAGSRTQLGFAWLDDLGNVGTAIVMLSGLGSGGAARSTQMVPFGDRLLVLDKTGSSQAQFVWVYPR